MHFVDRDRRVQRVLIFSLVHPVFIAPVILVDVVNDRRGFRSALEVKRVRIGLLNDEAESPPLDFELIESLFSERWNKDFPDARARVKKHGMAPAVPLIEVAD